MRMLSDLKGMEKIVRGFMKKWKIIEIWIRKMNCLIEEKEKKE